MIDIYGNNQSATISADFDALRSRLQGTPCWGADVLRLAGEHGWRVATAGRYSKGPFGARVIDDGPDCMIAWGISGKKSFLAYRIERKDTNQVRVTPLAYLDKTRKAALAVPLALIFIVPVLLAPFLWWVYEIQTLRASRVYLPTFGRFLEGL